MIIKIRRKTQNQILIWILFFGPFLIAPAIQFLGLTQTLKYVLDIVWAILLLTMVFRKNRKIEKSAKNLLVWVIAFGVFTAFNYIVNFQSVFYYLWGFRNNFRGYVLFFAVIYYFKERYIYETIGLLNKLFNINAVIMFIQFFVLGYNKDKLGGIFGVKSGCNGYLNLYLCIMLVIVYAQYMEKEVSLKHLAFKAFFMLILAAMAELKFFYIEFAILIGVGLFIGRSSGRKYLILLVSVIAVFIGYKVFINIFPDIDLSISGLYEYASSSRGYTSSGDLNRLNFMHTINSNFLKGIKERLFGMGLGNCDFATGIGMVTSPFSEKYGFLHYAWMSTTFMYLENGWVGLIFFFGFFVLICIKSLCMIKQKRGNRLFCLVAFLCSIVALMNGFYNNSLRSEAGYMIYFIIAIPWCLADEKKVEYAQRISSVQH